MHNFIWEGEIDLDICDKLVEFYETCTYLTKRQYESNPFNDAKGNGKDSLDLHCHTMLAKNEKCLNDYLQALIQCVDKYYRTYPQAGQIECHVSPLFNIQKYKPGGGYKVWHFERGGLRENRERYLVWMTYLSDNPDGGTEWMYQDKYIPAKKGATVIWPAEWTHTHRGVIDEEREKILITGWIDIEGGFVI
mgnify:FL=1|tara:strand:- start:1397 stop:1972 length:576 start_codon:yes stop_codon:yes gene_type:complete